MIAYKKRGNIMKKETKKSPFHNVAIIVFASVIIAVILFENITKTSLSQLFILLPALFILGESIRQVILKHNSALKLKVNQTEVQRVLLYT